MIRKAFVMQLHPGNKEEYTRRHNPIWPELEEQLKANGIHSYSIFLHEATGQLFGYVEVDETAHPEKVGKTDVGQRWWTYMKDLMETNPDNSPVSVKLEEVFHIEK